MYFVLSGVVGVALVVELRAVETIAIVGLPCRGTTLHAVHAALGLGDTRQPLRIVESVATFGIDRLLRSSESSRPFPLQRMSR
jgi:hypothetical protein